MLKLNVREMMRSMYIFHFAVNEVADGEENTVLVIEYPSKCFVPLVKYPTHLQIISLSKINMND